jgi:hypothetical protein
MTLADKKFGAWTVMATDASGKRVTCHCVCGAVRAVSAEMLLSGSSTSCGCVALSRHYVESLRAEAAQRRRRRERDWRPQR